MSKQHVGNRESEPAKDLTHLSSHISSSRAAEGESIAMPAFKLAALIISRLCLRIHLCKHYANVFSALSLESDGALPV